MYFVPRVHKPENIDLCGLDWRARLRAKNVKVSVKKAKRVANCLSALSVDSWENMIADPLSDQYFKSI